MIIVATFNQTIELDQALSEIEKINVSNEHMMVVFMNEQSPRNSPKRLLVDIKATAFEIGIAVATGLSVVGASIGFTLHLGPIIWGLIMAIIGFFLGYFLYVFFHHHHAGKEHNLPPEISVIIQCPQDKYQHISTILWKNKAFSIGVQHNTSFLPNN